MACSAYTQCSCTASWLTSLLTRNTCLLCLLSHARSVTRPLVMLVPSAWPTFLQAHVVSCNELCLSLCTHTGDISPTWDPMPTVENCRVFVLAPDSHEYKEVADLFSHTVHPGVNVPGMMIPYERIVRIRRIQNRTLYLQYMGRKQAMQCHNLPHHPNEWKLWHGCSKAVVKKISEGGLNRSFAATRGSCNNTCIL